MSKAAITILKYGISLGLLGYLFYSAAGNESFAALRDEEKNWPLLAAAYFIALGGLSLTFIRWCYLVRALDIPFRMSDAFRLGFLGYLLTFFTLGVVGGDTLKAVFLARERPLKRTEAVASVVLDRMIGLYALVLTAAIGLLFLDPLTAVGLTAEQQQTIRIMTTTVWAVALAGALSGLLLLPGVLSSHFWKPVTSIPKVGAVVDRILGALESYRQQKAVLLLALVMSCGTHLLFALAVYCTSLSLGGESASLLGHLAIVPICMLANALPLPGGLGAFEYALTFLYTGFFPNVTTQHGFITALAFRVITILLASIGLAYYVAHRRQVKRLLAEANARDDDSETAPAEPATDSPAG
ncbi:lysylphosphatidylglycerol synthase transmembrane domain-containing protein [Lignipirellula cremea]|uniref:lysylphosphatidylglycerol synthase transmembrane domain-containing protein n=1 Tax=Lignipirellula cremea TaxID=2528010 RepID=UPI0018D1F970|nr:lysylphosphatidylglycerol synthase transmembrane domain-containing protein [Lignipirellula cremea]